MADCRAMLEAELAHRDATKRARLLRQARLPVHKSAEGFDWSHVRFSEGWGRDDMLSLGFVGAREDLVFFGKTGRGKTHMAVALAMRTAAAIWSSPNTAPHRLNSRFVVMTTDCRS